MPLRRAWLDDDVSFDRLAWIAKSRRTSIRTVPVERLCSSKADGLRTCEVPGRSQRSPQRTIAANWREPKLMTIFVHDEQGKMRKATKATIDGTLLGPDAIAKIVAMHLHRLAAAQALSVTFVADGAPSIWNRIDRIIDMTQQITMFLCILF